ARAGEPGRCELLDVAALLLEVRDDERGVEIAILVLGIDVPGAIALAQLEGLGGQLVRPRWQRYLGDHADAPRARPAVAPAVVVWIARVVERPPRHDVPRVRSIHRDAERLQRGIDERLAAAVDPERVGLRDLERERAIVRAIRIPQVEQDRWHAVVLLLF